MNEPQWPESEWREAHLAAARLCAYAAGREVGRKEAAERLGILEGSEVWHMMTDGNDLQEAGSISRSRPHTPGDVMNEPNAEQIVRSLAAKSAPQCDSIPPTACLLCDAEERPFGSESLAEPAGHEVDCPWRLAREWVSSTSAARTHPETS